MAKKELTEGQLILVVALIVVGAYFLYTNYFQAYADTYTIANTGTGTITCYMYKYNDGNTFTISQGSSFSYMPPMPGDFDSGKCYCPATYLTDYVNVEFPHSGSYLTFNVDLSCSNGGTTTTLPSTCSNSQLIALADENNDCYITNSEVSIVTACAVPELAYGCPSNGAACYQKLQTRMNAGYNTYEGCSPETCDESSLADYDTDGDCIIDGSELNSANGDACYNALYNLYMGNDPYPSCTPKTCQAYGYYVTQPSGKTCAYGYKNPPGLYCYYNCVSGTTTTLAQTCEANGYYSTPQSGKTCSQVFVNTISKYCYACSGATTTTLVPPCEGLNCYQDVLLGVALGLTLLGFGYLIYTRK